MAEIEKPKLMVRNATLADVAEIAALSKLVYGAEFASTSDHIRGQITNYPAGQFVAVYDGRIVGYCATFRTTEAIARRRHTWGEITGGGFASRHDPTGEILYGMDVCVDPSYRRLRVAQRLYNARKRLCRALGLRGIVYGGRLPGLAARIGQVSTPAAYVKLVSEGKLRDRVLGFQLRNGFELLGVLENYMPSDRQSLGHAAHLAWWNPGLTQERAGGETVTTQRLADTIRIGCVQFQQRAVHSFEEFARNVEHFVDAVAEYQADFVLFPELFTLQLLSIDNRHVPAHEAISALTAYTPRLVELLSGLAVRRNINIVGGSHPVRDDSGRLLNMCHVCLRDGSIHTQGKIHPTPNEKYWWRIEGADVAATIPTDSGPIGVMICYDAEFPEVARHLVDQGALVLFVPFFTDERQSFLRVRYCCQARAVENQCYVAMAGNVGNLPDVENADVHYAQSAILTPCDFPFARDGIAADTTPNVEMVSIADLSLSALRQARATGTVRNLSDRRFDLYRTEWKPPATRA
jgi:predicted amidohydrolase/GNAT superfamily N-acetyltransferase